MNTKDSQQSQCRGYTVYCYAGPTNRCYLLDMAGSVVHEWDCDGQPVKVLPGGSLIGRKRSRLGKDPQTKDNLPESEPGTQRPPWQDAIEMIQLDWDGREEWSFADWDDDQSGTNMSRQHHDFQREGNPVGYYAPGQDFVTKGNTLLLSHKNRQIDMICGKRLLDDVIYEVDWDGNLTGFEWHGVDHIDDIGFDSEALETIQKAVNYDEQKDHFDWLHINSASLLGKNRWFDESGDERFNPENIIISSRSANFIAIISRATGKLVWKLGPDFHLESHSARIGQFVGQHHAHMIPQGLPGEGNILVFDNGGESGYGGKQDYPRYTRQYSRVVEIDPITFEIVWQYGSEKGEDFFFSHFISGMQRLPNGNTLITDGDSGRLIEVTPDKYIVWEYLAPAAGAFGNKIYRAYRVPPEWIPLKEGDYPTWASLYES